MEAIVTLPDGRKAKVTGNTQEEVMARVDYVRAQLVAPDTERLMSQNETRLAQQKVAEDLSTPQAMLAAAGSAFNDLGENFSAAGQYVGEQVGILGPNDRAKMERSNAADDEGFRALRDNRELETTVGRGGAQAAMFLGVPGGATGGIARRAVTGAMAGGVTAAASTGLDESPYTNFFVGSTFGALAPAVVSGISNVIRNFSSKPIQVISEGRLTPEAIQALELAEVAPEELSEFVATQLRKDGVLSVDEANRFNLFQEFDPNFSPLKAQITQKGSDFIEMQELAKSSNLVRTTLDNQEKIIGQKFDDLIFTLGGQNADTVDASIAVTAAVRNRVEAADQAVSEAYKAAAAAANKQNIVKPGSLYSKLNAFASDDQSTGGLLSAVMGDLKRRGIVSSDGKLQGKVSVEVAEEVRKNLNALIAENPKARARAGKILKDALDADVERIVGEDVFKGARASKARLERSLEAEKATRRLADRDTLVEKLIEGRANPDTLINQIMNKSTRSEDVEHLVSFLKSGTRAEIEAGEQALAEIRSSLVRELMKKSMFGKTEDGGLMFSGKAFAKALDGVGNQKLSRIFDQGALSALGQLRRIGELRTPVQGTALGLGPTGQGMGMLRDTAMSLADAQTARFVALVMRLTDVKKLREHSRAVSGQMNPLKETEQAFTTKPNARGARAAGSAMSLTGAVTADRLPEET